MIGINGKFAKAFIIQQNHDLDESHYLKKQKINKGSQ